MKVEKAKAAYNEAKQLAKSEVWKVRTEAEKDKFAKYCPTTETSTRLPNR
jgi:hypothetical protein